MKRDKFYPRKRGIETRKKILEFSKNFITEKYYPPTLKDISEGLGIGKSTAYINIGLMERFGEIYSREYTRSRIVPKNIKITFED